MYVFMFLTKVLNLRQMFIVHQVPRLLRASVGDQIKTYNRGLRVAKSFSQNILPIRVLLPLLSPRVVMSPLSPGEPWASWS